MRRKTCGAVLLAVPRTLLPALRVRPDGGYLSRSESVAVSADHRAILIAITILSDPRLPLQYDAVTTARC